MLQDPDALNSVAVEKRAGVVDQLKTLQRVQAISPTPDAVSVLLRADLKSAFDVSEMPQSTFMNAHKDALGEETAQRVYTYAIDSRPAQRNRADDDARDGARLRHENARRRKRRPRCHEGDVRQSRRQARRAAEPGNPVRQHGLLRLRRLPVGL